MDRSRLLFFFCDLNHSFATIGTIPLPVRGQNPLISGDLLPQTP